MSRARELMAKAHRESGMSPAAGVQASAVAKPTPQVIAREVEPETELARPVAQVVQTPTPTPVIHTNETSTPVEQIARPELALERYGINPWKSNFNIYNKDIVSFVRNFSSENQLNGGKAITKSQMIEVLLDVMFYDLELKPDGFQSPGELRKHLQEKLR